ncbi:hypothetical protein GCM10009119_38670 [Algoriphagus jejuensis]|uniref:Dolichyl-phosphate-mannose-protein mannosyltransferase n=1 Tax=Algoriphagus jejuensis TaxID=419934 RepID=A0ABP3YJN0_9BACT
MTIGKLGKVYGPLILLGGILAVYVYFFSFLGTSYSPYYGDEFFYFKNSESYYLTHSLKASFTYSGNGARLLGADAHGPAYPLLYGAIAKLIGWNGLTIPIVNGSILILAILMLLWSKEASLETKPLHCLLILGSPITLFYAITYLPELIQIAGAIGLYLILQRYLSTKSLTDFLVLSTYVLILGSIRSTWFFAFFGLILLSGPIKGLAKIFYFILGLILPFLYQHFLHEQVPNTFSGLGEMIAKQGLFAGLDAVFFNLKRNIYFAFTYTEGLFYTVQKLWIAGSLIVSALLFRKSKLIGFGVIVLLSMIAFNVILYKNYAWTELRMYAPLTFFLNLGMVSDSRNRHPAIGLTSLSLLSFILILPLQQTLMNFRTHPNVLSIPDTILQEIENLDAPLVYVDTTILNEYQITEVPVLTSKKQQIRYILPYYSIPMAAPIHIFKLDKAQLTIKSEKILSQ